MTSSDQPSRQVVQLPALADIKRQLIDRIESALKARHLTQAQAAALLNVTQPDVSKLLRAELRQFSLERLALFLVALDHNVQIRITARRRGDGPARVVVR